MSDEPRPAFLPVGDNPARLFAMDARERACRLSENIGLRCIADPAGETAVVLANMNFAWDPAWLKEIASRPNSALVKDGRAVLVHVPGDEAPRAIAAMEDGQALADRLEILDADTARLTYRDLRKKDRPFVLPLDPADPLPVERAAYDASYKGVTDALTLYVWRRPAFHLTRWAAAAGLTPNAVTAIGALFCLLAFYLFWIGSYWPGIAAGLVFMVLDTVDGKLARCTGSSSKWGDALDHGIDLVHPPFWWWAWAHGLAAYGTPLEPVYEAMLLWAIILGYVAQRVIEGLFIWRFAGIHIHVWRPIDSKFRLVTARRNPNMVILAAALLFGRPDVGFELVALWTLLSLIFHAVRLAQASAQQDRGQPVVSWLS